MKFLTIDFTGLQNLGRKCHLFEFWRIPTNFWSLNLNPKSVFGNRVSIFHCCQFSLFLVKIWICELFSKFSDFLFFFKVTQIHMRQAPVRGSKSSKSRISLFSLVNMCVYWCVYTVPFGHREERYRPETWYRYSPRADLKLGFFFRKSDPEGG